MTVPPKVSVILTCYNTEKYLRESIESVLNQTYREFELIIWYDESTDNSWNIISAYTDERIRVFRHEPNGFAAHFQQAISEVARGEYIAVHHSDDAWELDKLEKQVAFLDLHPQIGAVFTQVLIIGENSEPLEDESHFYYEIFNQSNRTRQEWLNRFFYQGNALCHPSVLIRRVCYEDCGVYRHALAIASDLDMWVRLCLKYEIHVLPEKLTRFRVRADEMNASGNRPDAHIRGVFDLFQILNNYRSIESVDEFKKIFPNANKYFRPEGFDMGFALAMAALESYTPIYTKFFGLQLLYEIFSDLERAERIKELYRFGYRDFFTLTGKHDVFSTAMIPNLSAQFAEKVRENQVLLSQRSGMAWSLVLRLQRFRLWVAPEGSFLHKALKLGFQSLRIWKNEGLSALYRKGIQKISQGPSDGYRHRTTDSNPGRDKTEKRSASPLDLGAITNVQSIPSSYDVVILAGIPWQSNSRRLQQLALRFTQDGHRVFHASAASISGTKTRVRLIGGRIFEVQLPDPGPESAQRTASSEDIFSALRDELGIVDAVCLVDSPIWAPAAFSLRERFGWRAIYDVKSAEELEEESLILKSDLLLVGSQILIHEIEKRNPNSLLLPDPAEAGSNGQAADQVREDADFPSQKAWEESYLRISQRIPALFPRVSIIIVTYNNMEYTRQCLESMYGNTIYPNYEVIVVDNASNDETSKFLRSFESHYDNFKVIYNTENKGFAGANNQGIATAHGDYIVLLNNDTVVTRIWLSRLINHLRDPQVGLVGPLTNGVSNEAHVDMTFTDVTALDAFSTQLAKDRSNRLTPIKVLAMYCMAGRSEVIQQLGPLDEQFRIGMFEDDDYSLRMRQAGYRIVVAEDVFIHHFGRSGFKLMGEKRYLEIFEENHKKFEAKWRIEWQQHESGTLAETRRLTSELMDILNANPQARGVIIFPPTIGWNISLFQRPHQLARAFAKQGFLVFFSTHDRVDDVRGFKQLSRGLYLSRVPWAVFDLVDRPVIFTLPYNRDYIFQLRQPLVVYEVIDDLEVFPGDKARLQRTHEVLLEEADVVVVTADRLMDQVRSMRADAILCPNAVELEHFSRGADPLPIPQDLTSIVKTDRPIIGYTGALARWFDYDLVRAAAQKHPDWNFVLIGPNHDDTLIESNLLSIPNIHWLGARDYSILPTYLCHFTITTIPFLINNITLATSPIKLFEYMAAGKPIVTTDLPECRKYPGVLAAHSAQEYIEHLERAITLTADPVYLKQLYQTAQENTWDARVHQIIEALVLHRNRMQTDL